MDILNLLKQQVSSTVDLPLVTFGNCLSASDRAYLIANSTVKEYDKGDKICQQAHLESHAYLILQGSVMVTENVEENVVQLAQLHSGDLFGEISALCTVPRTATVTATCRSVVLEISSHTLRQLILTTPNLQRPIYHYMYERTLKTALSAAPLMKHIA